MPLKIPVFRVFAVVNIHEFLWEMCRYLYNIPAYQYSHTWLQWYNCYQHHN